VHSEKNRFYFISKQAKLLIELREFKVIKNPVKIIITVTIIHFIIDKFTEQIIFSSVAYHFGMEMLLSVNVKLQKRATISFAMSVCTSVRLSTRLSAWKNSAPTRRILIKFGV
jgi:hypothetical protein